MRVSPIHTNYIAFSSNKKKNDSEVEEVAAVGGGAIGGKAAYELSKINKVATKTSKGAKEVGNIMTKLPQEAKNYKEGLTLSLRRFLKTIHMEHLVGKGAGRFFGVVGGAVSAGSAVYGITEAAGAYSGLIVNNNK